MNYRQEGYLSIPGEPGKSRNGDMSTWKFVKLKGSEISAQVRYLSRGNDDGFLFAVITGDSLLMDGLLMDGWATGEGIRHIWIVGDGKDKDIGYFYYPDIELLCGVFSLLRDLERELCFEKMNSGESDEV